jgi:hypothetical protein
MLPGLKFRICISCSSFGRTRMEFGRRKRARLWLCAKPPPTTINSSLPVDITLLDLDKGLPKGHTPNGGELAMAVELAKQSDLFLPRVIHPEGSRTDHQDKTCRGVKSRHGRSRGTSRYFVWRPTSHTYKLLGMIGTTKKWINRQRFAKSQA